jgi:glycosyltransferase involved in cell wall biosynthesis
MRILAVHPFLRSERIAPRAGGMARVSLQLTEGLLRAGHEVAVLPIPERFATPMDLSLRESLSVRILAPMELPGRGDIPRLLGGIFRQPMQFRHWYDAWYRIFMMVALRKAMRTFRPDIIHNHHAASPFPAMYAALGERTPTVLTHHHFEPGVRLSSYRAVVFPSDYARRSFGLPIAHNRTLQTVIYNPVDPVFSDDAGEQPERQKSLVFIGALNRRKGILLLLQVYQCSARLREYALTVFGDGELREEAQAFASLHQLPVRFAGWQPPLALRAALQQAAALVLPSRQESFGVAMAEALCCGAPVAGWGPTVREVGAALRLPVGIPIDAEMLEPQVLAEQILSLVADRTYSEAWRRAIGTQARAEFGLDRYITGNVAVYKQALGE